ncbi:Two component transcriptional regulator, LuxR family [Bosea sp. LC85]|uniref:LuxR C-terminal-related transcriptional regulator n=1 Tax=Bosea sp. LC85 TaxID=1502851 RepID=UPI0004E2B0C0|nr:response regulator transcription factor [Bosea sp. LC85]KFC65306.1 Two component transcriptional regulator, LuxR family [Bosea sp. LC85]
MPDLSVAIVDDHPMLMEGIAALLKRWGGFMLAATGNVADHIVSIARTHHPDEMIVDLSMAGDVFQAIADAMKVAPGTKIVVFTASASTEDAIKALDAGATGYVLKGSPGEDLFEALQAAQRGEVYVTPAFATKLICALKEKTFEQQKPVCNRLSVREEQIVNLLLLGKMNNEIAHELSLSAKTVKGYMTNLMAKLHARNRLEVVLAAQKLNAAANPAPVTRRP